MDSYLLQWKNNMKKHWLYFTEPLQRFQLTLFWTDFQKVKLVKLRLRNVFLPVLYTFFCPFKLIQKKTQDSGVECS